MKPSILFDFVVDKSHKKVFVTRTFQAPIDLVWKAWTEAELLDQWWAPMPYTNHTKKLELKPGGLWHYYMKSPSNEIHWCFFAYEQIVKERTFSGKDAFCDEYAKVNSEIPSTHWKNNFTTLDEHYTEVKIELTYETLEALETIIAMGFKEGFTMGLNQLDALLTEV